MPKTVITLRAPAESIDVAADEAFVDFSFGDKVITLFGPTVDGKRDLRSVPWDRVVSIDTKGAIVPPADQHTASGS